jgi:putative DNA primase/helicase
LFELRPDEPDEEVAVTYHPNNAGRRMVRMYGDDLLFCGGEWFCWDAKRWCVDKSKHVERLTRAVVETYKDESADLYAQAAAVREEREEEEDRKRKDELEAEADRVASRAAKCWQFHVQMSRPKGVKDIAEAASWDLVVQHSELDSDPYVLNAQNGVIDLRTGELLPHRRCDLITKITPGDYNPDAESDLWRLYLDAVFGDDDDMRRYVQRLLGSALVGLQTEDLIILLIGPGGTGKTTFLEACRRAIGDYGKPVPFDIFLEKKHSGGTTPELASLPGVRMVTSAEPKENVGFDVARLKMLSGGDEVMANPKYLAAFTFDPAFTIVLATNFAPKASGTDSALWRRVKAIRFERVIAKPNRKLRQHLAGKLPGKEADPRHQQAVLAWLVEGCRDYLENGLGDPPGAVLDSTDSTRREMDPLWGFLAEECVLDPAAWTPTDVLYRSYKLYATERGMTLVDDAAWGTTLNRFGATVRRRTVSGRTRRGWEGIRLRDADHDADHDAAQKEGNRPSDAWKGDSGRHDAE